MIRFRHPGYSHLSEEEDVLLYLPCTDPKGGLRHRTAKIACAIVANNAWEGYLSDKCDGGALTIGEDDLLTNKDYWFHVPNQRSPYPVVPTFQDWKFPHDSMPPGWTYDPSPAKNCPAVSCIDEIVRYRDKTCRISNYRNQLEVAYVCPMAEKAWFGSNNMKIYNADVQLQSNKWIDDQRNKFLLRSDLHRLMDNKANRSKLVIVPKFDKWMAHMLGPAQEYGVFYQNRMVHGITNVSPQFLLARFAWAIFPLLNGFIAHGRPRHLVYLKNPKAREKGDRWVSEEMIWNLDKFTNNSRSKYSRRTKRTREETEEVVEETDAGAKV